MLSVILQTIENEWSWVIAGYVIVYGAMFGLTGWLWTRLNRVRRRLDQEQ
jgi:DNA-binding transcriptional regulator of glucitol operon